MKLYSILLSCLLLVSAASAQQKKQPDYYLIKIYHCSNQQQLDQIEKYLQAEYIPFVKKNGIKKVGVFTPLANDTALDKQVYVWIPSTQLTTITSLEHQFEKMNPFDNHQLIHLDSIASKAPYNRIETMLSVAFKNQLAYLETTDFKKSAETVYEFRSYESSTENLHLRKVHMFNEGGEIDLFKKLHFNALFYARVIVGAHMPNLVYMTRFNNIAEREAHWKQFGNDPDWKKMSSLSIYANTVSKHEVVLLKAAKCSEF